MSHVVTAPLVIAHTDSGDAYLYEGATVPSSISKDELKRLVDEKFVVEVADPSEPVEHSETDPTVGLDLAGLQAYAAEHQVDLGRASSEEGVRAKILEARAAQAKQS